MPRTPAWRDEAASALVLKHLDLLDPPGPVLVLQDPRPDVATALEARGRRVVRWQRRAFGGRPASPWPPPADEGGEGHDGYGAAFLRLPSGKDELEMAVHAAVHRLRPGAPLFVYGAKDEGAASAPGRMEPVLERVGTVATGGRCRLLEGWRTRDPAGPPHLRAGLSAWRIETSPPLLDMPWDRWVTYPGLFAAGRLDEGTALLVETLEGQAGPAEGDPPPRLLDFGCGDGVLAAVMRSWRPELSCDLLDVDAVSLAAAEENLSAGPVGTTGGATGEIRLVLGDGLDAVRGREYDLIVANPPYHEGKAETTDEVQALALHAPTVLRAGGMLWMVVQRRMPAEPWLRTSFRDVEAVADRGAFRVWRVRQPVPAGG